MKTQMFERPLKGVFFDMDGVLYDSMKNHALSWEKAMAEFGIHYPLHYSYLNEGRTSKSTINWAFNKMLNRNATTDEIDKIYELKTLLMSKLPIPPMFNDIDHFIADLKTNGIQVMIVTGSNQKSLIDRIQNDFNITKDLIITGADVSIGKPHPEPYLKALERSGLKQENVIIIENAPLGIKSAKAAGVYTVAVNTGLLENDILASSGADWVIDSISELISNWQRIINNYNRKI